jgi:hypothetical protein
MCRLPRAVRDAVFGWGPAVPLLPPLSKDPIPIVGERLDDAGEWRTLAGE